MSALTDTTAWLVSVASETGQESELRDLIADRLAPHPQVRVADSLVVGDPKPGSILLVGHLDTVPLQGDRGPLIEGDRLYGLGATDMKAGLAVMIHLIEELPPGRLVGIFYAGEEGPMAGNQLGPILDSLPVLRRAEAAVVLEPTDRRVEAGCNGAINAKVGFDGVAAHSARPWLGRNAITEGARLLLELGSIEPEDHRLDGLLFREVITVTTAEGGVARNIVPPRFELNVNYRFAPDRALSEAVSRLRQLCKEADSFEVTDQAPAGLVLLDHPLFQALIHSSEGPVSGKQGWTDVAQLTQAGIPAVNFGPGEGDLAHKPGESVRLSDLDWAYESLLSALG